MNDFENKIETLYAKSNPEETIRQHTDNLIKQAELLKILGYIPTEEVYQDLLVSCEYHDYGKMNDKFQQRLKSKKRMSEDEIPHNVLSVYFIKKEKCNLYENVVFAVLYHHFYQESPYSYIVSHRDVIYDELGQILRTKCTNKEFIYLIKALQCTAHLLRPKTEEEKIKKKQLILLKGFLHKCDYSASAGIDCEISNDFLDRTMQSWKEKLQIKYNALQKFCLENREKNIIVTAPTGMGKTEAGLLWCGDNKCFFILPLRTAINAMYERFKEKLFTDYKEQVALLHSDMKSYYVLQDKEYDKIDEQGIDFDYINRSKQLSMPITVCTPDQIFNFVLKYPGYEHKLATMSYAKLIIDEIQMYTPELLAAVMYGIRLIKEMGGKIAVLTATLPPFVRHELQKIYGNDFAEQDFSDYGIVRHNRKTFEKEMTAEDIISVLDNRQDEYSKKILVVCNSIDVADRIYAKLKEYYRDGYEVHLFHAHFIRKDRKEKEKAILEASADRTKKELWVSTSVVEASLDIDFDILFTELSDLFSLFQRMGRVNRKGGKPYDKTNCYVYTELQGNAKRFSFYDKDIYRLSKEAVMNSADGIIDEKQKKYLIDTYLSLENVRKTAYLKTYSETLQAYEDLTDYFKKDLSEFRQIQSYDVIPKEIYEEETNRQAIEQAKRILSSGYRLSDEEKSGLTETEVRKKISQNKLIARNIIESFMVPVSLYRVRNYRNRNLSDDRLEIIVIDKCHYDEESGLSFEKLEKKSVKSVDDEPDDDSNDNIL